MKKALLLACIFSGVLSACSGGGDGGGDAAPPPPTTGGGGATVPGGAIVANEDMTAGLKGVDGNSNGIRDDIDGLIAGKYAATPAMKKAAEQKARTLQKSMEATTRGQARIAGNEIRRAGACATKSIPEAAVWMQLSKDVEALTANTQERFQAYWKAEGLAAGMVFAQAVEPVCD